MKYKKRNKKAKFRKNIKYIKLIITIIISLLFLIKIKSILVKRNFFFFISKTKFKVIKYKRQIYFYNKEEIIDKYLAPIPSKYEKMIKVEKGMLNKFVSLHIISKYSNKSSNEKLKKNY